MLVLLGLEEFLLAMFKTAIRRPTLQTLLGYSFISMIAYAAVFSTFAASSDLSSSG